MTLKWLTKPRMFERSFNFKLPRLSFSPSLFTLSSLDSPVPEFRVGKPPTCDATTKPAWQGHEQRERCTHFKIALASRTLFAIRMTWPIFNPTELEAALPSRTSRTYIHSLQLSGVSICWVSEWFVVGVRLKVSKPMRAAGGKSALGRMEDSLARRSCRQQATKRVSAALNYF